MSDLWSDDKLAQILQNGLQRQVEAMRRPAWQSSRQQPVAEEFPPSTMLKRPD